VCVEFDRSLLFIDLNGPDVTDFDPVKYCTTWLKAGHHSALDKETGKPAKQILPETRHSIFK